MAFQIFSAIFPSIVSVQGVDIALRRIRQLFFIGCPVVALSLTTSILPTTSASALRSATVVVQTNPRPVTLIAQAEDFSELEKQVLDEMNQARTNPKDYISNLKDWRDKFDGNRVDRGPGNNKLKTQEGVAAVDAAIEFLLTTPSRPALKLSPAISEAAAEHVRDQGPKGLFSHTGSDGSTLENRLDRYATWVGNSGENISFGFNTGREVVMQLIIDDGVPSRGHRINLFRPEFKVAGVACGPHAKQKIMCVIDYVSESDK